MISNIGFTGTRKGMTDSQKEAIEAFLDMLCNGKGMRFRHGKCHGSDLEAAEIAVRLGYIEDPFPAGDDPLARDRVIVNGAEFMLATPRNYRNINRGSGTWYTIRYATRQAVPGVIIWPDGMASPIKVRKHPYHGTDEG